MRQIAEDIKKNEFRPVYLLYGEERYLKRQYRDKLRAALCADDDTMNTHFYEGKDISIGEVIDLAETLPFLAEHRVIFITDSGLFKSGGEKLAEYLPELNPSTIFIFTETEVDKRSKMYKAVQAKGYVAEFETQNENTLSRWVVGILSREGKKISENTVRLFLTKTGTDMNNIQMELEKLICYVGSREVVTSEDVETICTTRITGHIFEMINCIAEKQKEKALELYYELLTLKEPPMRILFLIARQCNILLQVKEMASKGYDSKAIAPKIGVPPFIAQKHMAQANKFKTSTLRLAVEKCVEAEEVVKQGRMNDHMSVEMLILTVL